MTDFSQPVAAIVIMSIFTLAFYFERLLATRRYRRSIAEGLRTLQPVAASAIGEDGRQDAARNALVSVATEKPQAWSNADRLGDCELLEPFDIETNHGMECLRISIAKIGTVAMLSPYIGPFGKALGITKAFARIGATGSSNSSDLV
jgi:biopolymer transport protein ExbB/TolQ